MKAIIFDMDGTMIDNMMVHHQAWKAKLESLDIFLSLEEVRNRIHGVNVEILEREFPGRFSLEERIRISAEKEATYRELYEPELLPGLPELLHELKGNNIPLAVGSAAPPENVHFVFNALNLWPYFEAIRHSEDVTKGKPHPEVYLSLANDLRLNAADCLVFEDTPTGAKAAERAGAKVIVVTTSHHPEEFSDNNAIVKYITDFTDFSVSDFRSLA